MLSTPSTRIGGSLFSTPPPNGDAHGMYRALPVRNVDTWYTAFNVQRGQTLYLAPEQRVRVW
jgi:hypothetical protein